ncbi:MAG: hypothetical protein RI907_1408 [Pseudomonadota bacterium]|jgi:uncharacterized membrane protein
MNNTSHDEGDLNAPLVRATAILAAGLTGLGVIFWLAANWDSLGRITQFGLLQAAMVASTWAARSRRAWRTPAGLLLFLLSGGLLAHVGQTYQTGADPWQLFAWWALLGLPLAWSVRHDAAWAAWVTVAMTGLSLWVVAHTSRIWRTSDLEVSTHLLAWGLSWLIVGATSPHARPWTGAGLWSHRLALTFTVVAVTSSAVASLMTSEGSPLYGLGLLTLSAAAVVLSRPRWFDLYGLSTVALGLNVCLFSGWADLLFKGSSGLDLAAWLLLGLSAAGMLGATVKGVMHVASRAQPNEVTP